MNPAHAYLIARALRIGLKAALDEKMQFRIHQVGIVEDDVQHRRLCLGDGAHIAEFCDDLLHAAARVLADAVLARQGAGHGKFRQAGHFGNRRQCNARHVSSRAISRLIFGLTGNSNKRYSHSTSIST